MGKGIELGRAETTFLVCEAVCILFYGLFTEYGDKASPFSSADDDVTITNYIQEKYPFF
jgi:hypothetical protein